MISMTGFSKRPNCSKKDCEGEGLMLLQNRILCGDCFIKIEKKKQAMINSLLGDDEYDS